MHGRWNGIAAQYRNGWMALDSSLITPDDDETTNKRRLLDNVCVEKERKKERGEEIEERKQGKNFFRSLLRRPSGPKMKQTRGWSCHKIACEFIFSSLRLDLTDSDGQFMIIIQTYDSLIFE